MEIETTKQFVFPAAIMIGQILTLYIPYYNKQREDERKFDKNYLYTCIIGYIGLATIALQSDVVMAMELSVPSVMTLMFGGGLVQRDLLSKITPKKI